MKLIISTIAILLLSNISFSGNVSEELILSITSNSKIKPEDKWRNINRPCTFKQDNQQFSYVSLLTDISFEVTSFNETMDIDHDKVIHLIKHMINNHCSINIAHPTTGHIPAHTASIFFRKNPEVAKFIILNGGDLTAKTPNTDEHFPNMNAIDILNSIITKYPPQPERVEFIDFIKEVLNGHPVRRAKSVEDWR